MLPPMNVHSVLESMTEGTAPVCMLCQRNPATKTGSHILPFSLIREGAIQIVATRP